MLWNIYTEVRFTSTSSWYIKIFLSLKERTVWNSFHRFMRVNQDCGTSTFIGFPITIIVSLPRHVLDCSSDLYSLYKTYLHNLLVWKSSCSDPVFEEDKKALKTSQKYLSGIVELSVCCSSTESEWVMLMLSHFLKS